ncbi:MAG: D-lyxose/D-mannose family sugar isomerase [Promethearchaeota archaeon]
MKRSEINRIMRKAVEFFTEQKFFLPKFAYWTLEDWKTKGEEIQEIINNQLGWDITDFGSNNFSKKGLLLFTIRNGNLEDISKGGKNYCEKIMIVEEGQITPMHHHFQKAEDIINRGGGILMIQLYNTTKDDELADSPVIVSIDGIKKTFEAGSIIELEPGDSITLTSDIYHKFWAKENSGKLLIGEVSSVNDDRVDNKFLEEIGRFSDIEEDEEPLYLLYNDYKNYIQF